MTFSENIGVKIDTEVKNFLLRGVQREGLQSKFARAVGVTAMNLSRWLGETKRNVDYITWDQWDKVRDYLIKNGEIDASDIRWMPPSALRDALASSSASVSGSGNIVAGRDASGNSIALPPAADAACAACAEAAAACAEAVEAFRAELIMELIGMDVDSAGRSPPIPKIKDFWTAIPIFLTF